MAALVAGLFVAGCGSSKLGDRDSNSGGGSSSPATIFLQDPNARVDLPGRVSVFLRVENGDGSPAVGLTGADFSLWEDSILVSQTESFQEVRPQPQRFRNLLHLIIDRSNSVVSSGSAERVRESAEAFVDLLLPVEVATSSTFIKISWFDGQPNLHAIPGHDIGYSNDRSALLAALADLDDEPPLNASTNLYGAVAQALDDLDAEEQTVLEVPNRALGLVTFTDGTHQAGGDLTPSDLIARIDGQSMAGTPFSAFTIGVGVEIDPTILAALGPNGAVAAADFDVLREAFLSVGGRVSDLANSFYDLSYCSPKTQGDQELTIGFNGVPAASEALTFSADGFGAGCAFLDTVEHDGLAAPEESFHATDAVELNGGEVVVVGWRSAGCNGPGCGDPARAVVMRLLASDAEAAPGDVQDGRLDPSFGDGGSLLLEPLGGGAEVSGATSLVVDPATGELLVGGWSRTSAQSGFSAATVWRVAPDGGAATRVMLPSEGGADEAITDLVRTDAGDLVAGGCRGIGTTRSFALWRLFPTLDVDTSFGVDGRVLEPALPEPGVLGVESLVLGGGDRVYAVGEADQRVRVLARDVVNGAPVLAFGGDGAVDAVRSFDGGTYFCTPRAAALDGTGRLVVAGSYVDIAFGAPRAQPAVWRILDTGEPDADFHGSQSSPSFGTGVVTLRSGSTNDEDRDFGRNTVLEDVTLAPDGTVLATGWRDNREGHTDMVTLAFRDDGVSQGGYNIVGFVIHDGASADDSFDEGALVRVLDSGAVWVVGGSRPPKAMPSSPLPAESPLVWVDRDPARAFAPLADDD
ncbi:MAG: hypothetical protein AAFP86_04195 [Planctomycetota bacterium]